AYTLGALAEDVRAQAEALRSQPPASGSPPGALHLVGHSLGGLIARGAVLRAAAWQGKPEPFASLTLIGSGPGKVARWPRWRVRALGVALPLRGAEAVWRLLHPVAEPGEVGASLRRRWLANEPAQLRA